MEGIFDIASEWKKRGSPSASPLFISMIRKFFLEESLFFQDKHGVHAAIASAFVPSEVDFA